MVQKRENLRSEGIDIMGKLIRTVATVGLMVTLGYSTSTIVDGELVLANQCRDDIKSAQEIFKSNDGTDYSIIAKGEYALRVLNFAFCRNSDDEDYKETTKTAIIMALRRVYRDRQEPIPEGKRYK